MEKYRLVGIEFTEAGGFTYGAFYKALHKREKNEVLPEEFDFSGKLIGSWNIDYVDNSTSHVIKGEWHFSWVLEGMAVQDADHFARL